MDDFVVVVICQALRKMSKFTLFDKHQVQKEPGEERVYVFRSQFTTEGSQGRNSSKSMVRTVSQNSFATCSPACSQPSGDLSRPRLTAQAHQPRDGSIYGGQWPSTIN